MTVYYVDATTGNDADDGLSEGNAWETTEKVATEFNNGTFSAGDFIKFKCGETFPISADSYRLRLRNCDGTIDEPITLTSYGSGDAPILDVTANIWDGAIVSFGVDTESSYITIDGFEIKASASGTDFIGIYLEGQCDHWHIKNCHIHDIPSTAPGVSAGIVIRKGKWCSIENCTVENVSGEGIYLGKWTVAAARPFATIVRDTVIQNCDSEGMDIKDYAAFLTVYGCTIYNNGTATDGHDDRNVVVGGRWHHFYDCVIHGTRLSNKGGIYLGRYNNETSTSGRDCTVERCLIYDQTQNDGAVYMRGDDNAVYNCTIIDCIYGIYGNSADHGGVQTVKNNIFDGITNYPFEIVAGEGESHYDFDYNDYADGPDAIWYEGGGERNYAYVSGTLGQEINGITDDPSFAETVNYTLNSGSPCKNGGLSSVTKHDWNNEYTPAGNVDIGWQEYGWNVHRTFLSDFVDLSRFTGSTGVTAANLLAANISDTSDRYAYKSGLGNLNHFFAQFYVNKASVSMTSGDECVLFQGRTSGGTAVVQVLLQYDGSNYRIRASVLDDTPATNYTSYYNLTNDWSRIQIWWYAAEDSSFNDGFLILELDGTRKEIIDSLNSHDNQVDEIRLGTIGVDAGTSGILYFDNLEVDSLRELSASAPNDPPPPEETPTITVYTTTTVVVME